MWNSLVKLKYGGRDKSKYGVMEVSNLVWKHFLVENIISNLVLVIDGTPFCSLWTQGIWRERAMVDQLKDETARWKIKAVNHFGIGWWRWSPAKHSNTHNILWLRWVWDSEWDMHLNRRKTMSLYILVYHDCYVTVSVILCCIQLSWAWGPH